MWLLTRTWGRAAALQLPTEVPFHRGVVTRRRSREEDDDEPQKPRRRKIRQHINPLSEMAMRSAILAEDWVQSAFGDPALPMTVDIGSAMGGWCLESAKSNPERNFLGLEIRPGAHDAAVSRLEKAPLANCHFLKANANVDLKRILTDLDAANAQVDRILIQFPDPYFKKRHFKRRLVNPDVAHIIADALSRSASRHRQQHDNPFFAYLASDVKDLADYMREVFRNETNLREDPVSPDAWLDPSPLERPTERERAVLAMKGSTSSEPGVCFRCAFYVPSSD